MKVTNVSHIPISVHMVHENGKLETVQLNPGTHTLHDALAFVDSYVDQLEGFIKVWANNGLVPIRSELSKARIKMVGEYKTIKTAATTELHNLENKAESVKVKAIGAIKTEAQAVNVEIKSVEQEVKHVAQSVIDKAKSN